MPKSSDKRAPNKGGVPAPKARPRRQVEEPAHPKGGPAASTRGGARRGNAAQRKARDRGEAT